MGLKASKPTPLKHSGCVRLTRKMSNGLRHVPRWNRRPATMALMDKLAEYMEWQTMRDHYGLLQNYPMVPMVLRNFRDLYGNVEPPLMFYVRTSDMLSMYITLELIAFPSLNESTDLVSDRIVKHLKFHFKFDTQFDLALRTLALVKDFHGQEHIFSLIYGSVVKFTKEKKLLSNAMFAWHILSLRLWYALEKDGFVHLQIRETASSIRPGPDFCNEERFTPFCPDNFNENDAAEIMLSSLSIDNQLLFAACNMDFQVGPMPLAEANAAAQAFIRNKERREHADDDDDDGNPIAFRTFQSWEAYEFGWGMRFQEMVDATREEAALRDGVVVEDDEEDDKLADGYIDSDDDEEEAGAAAMPVTLEVEVEANNEEGGNNENPPALNNN